MAKKDLNGVTDLAVLTPQDIDSIGNVSGQQFQEIKTAQVRNFFSAVTAIRTDYKQKKKVTPEIERALILLKPKLAYAAGRQKVVKPLHSLMVQAVDAVANSSKKDEALSNFISLVETIVAYHKFYGGN